MECRFPTGDPGGEEVNGDADLDLGCFIAERRGTVVCGGDEDMSVSNNGLG
jgi:hypothetical protein